MPLLEMRETIAWRKNMAVVNFSCVDSTLTVTVIADRVREKTMNTGTKG